MSKILANLISAEKEDRLHHSYIFTGPENSAKLECVEEFLSQISTANENDLFAAPLSPEQVLQKIKRGHHPDLLKIQAVDDKIGVDEVRVLGRALSFAPLESKKRIVIIEKAESLNSQAANAVLKVLEEPPHHTVFILFCRDAADLLPTILSRCQEIRFAPPSDEALFKLLKVEFSERGDAELNRSISLAAGSLERAKKFLTIENSELFWRDACEQLIHYWENSPRVPSSLVKWAESISESEQVNWVVDIWEALLRDLSISDSVGAEENLIFPEFRVPLLSIRNTRVVDAASVSEKKSVLNRFRVYRELNGNLRLDFLALICDLNFSVGKRTLAV